MTVLDAYAVIAFLRGEPAAEQVRPLLEVGDAFLTAIGVGEVIDHLVRVGVDVENATLDLAELGLIDGSVVDSALGLSSGILRGRHYHRTRCAISMADAVAAETARSSGGRLVTSDPHLLDVCHRESIDVVVLTGSDGSRWVAPT